MKYIHILYIIVCLFASIPLYAHSVYIVIHGTWAPKYPWHTPMGDFFDALEKNIANRDRKVISFMWSGKIDHDSRELAALSLVKLIQSYPLTTHVNIIAHSHGGNVAILASHYLAKDPKNKHRIHLLYTLGTPVDAVSYMPNMNMITYLYNLFSFGDFIQPVFGMFSREFPPHGRIANIRVTINGDEPDHSDLHAPIIGSWILGIHSIFAKQNSGNFVAFNFNKPGVIHFNNTMPPRYEIDTNRTLLRQRDAYICQHLQNSFLNYCRNNRNYLQ